MGYFHSASRWKCSALAQPRGRERPGVGRQGSSEMMQGPSPPWMNPSPSKRAQWESWEMLPACGRCPARQVPPGQHQQGWRMLWPRRGHPHSPWADLEVLLCRAAGLPEQHWRETLDKHSAHPTVAALENPSSHARICRKSLHQSLNSSPTDATSNTSPMWGELWEMELTPTPSPTTPLSPSSEAVEHPAALQDPGGAIAIARGFPCPPQPAEPGSRTHRDPSSELGARASLLRFWDWERGWAGSGVIGAGWGGIDAKKGETHQKKP